MFPALYILLPNKNLFMHFFAVFVFVLFCFVFVFVFLFMHLFTNISEWPLGSISIGTLWPVLGK